PTNAQGERPGNGGFHQTGATGTIMVQILVQKAGGSDSIQELGEQIIQKSPAERGGSQAGWIRIQQPFGGGPLYGRRNRENGLPGAFDETAALDALLQAQCVQHELEAELLPLHGAIL